MEKFTGIIGVVVILGLAFLVSNNRKAINYRLVFSGLGIQLALALFILKTSIGQNIFASLGNFIKKILEMELLILILDIYLNLISQIIIHY